MTTDALVLSERRAAVLHLTLNRPSVLNALIDPLLDALHAELRAAQTDDSVRAIIITGAGRAFCAGQDLRTPDENGGIDVRAHLRDHYAPLIRTLRDIDKPVIAAVNGVAAGAGVSLALACDLRIAAESASLVVAFVGIGLVPDAGCSYFLPRLIGWAKATELAMLGDPVTARDALTHGLVNWVVADDSLGDAAQELADRLARGPSSVGAIKRLFNASLENDLDTQLDAEEDAQAAAATTDDFVEGVSAFVEKRPPVFPGR